jgi:hypothetical protein
MNEGGRESGGRLPQQASLRVDGACPLVSLRQCGLAAIRRVGGHVHSRPSRLQVIDPGCDAK